MSDSKDNKLSEAALEARRAYYREYNRKNKEKRKQWNDNHWEKIAKEMKKDVKE